MPKVSIIIPTYNRLSFLPKAIDSVLAQTFTNYEIIVVDDGSTDGTQAYVQEHYADKIILLQKEKGGPGAARNAGIRIARGVYIAFLDSDDLWLPEKLAIQTAYLEAKPEVAMVFTGKIDIHQINGTLYEKSLSCHYGAIELRQLLLDNFISTSSVFIRKEAFIESGLFPEETMPCGEDFALWLRVVALFKVESIPLALIRYKCHELNTMGALSSEEVMLQHIIIAKDFDKDFPGHIDSFFGGFKKFQARILIVYAKQAISFRQEARMLFESYRLDKKIVTLRMILGSALMRAGRKLSKSKFRCCC